MPTDFRLERKGELLVLRLTRPSKLNAITREILDGLEEALDLLEAEEVGALLITSDGDRAFSAGTDLEEARALDAEVNLEKVRRARELFFRLHGARVPSVAALNGLAYGGGAELALACSIRIGCPEARLAFPEITLGVFPAYGGTQLLPAVVGAPRALDLMMTGREVDADEALRMGLLNRISESRDSLEREAIAYCEGLCAQSGLAIAQILECVRASSARVSRTGLDLEAEAFETCMRALAEAHQRG